MKRPDGRFAAIVAEGIHTVRLSEIRIQNVASRVLLTPSDDFRDAEVRQVIMWTLTDQHKALLAPASVIDVIQTKVFGGALRLLWLDPSVGAELGVICERVQIEH
jgi:hypothetical protein